jgi:hypothetical protein
MNFMEGRSTATFLILPMLGYHPAEYPRLRDCFIGLKGDENEGLIHVHAQIGGSARDSHAREIEWLTSFPTYVTDYDDSLDSAYATHATFVFGIPEEWVVDFGLLMLGKLLETSNAYRELLYKTFPTAKESLDKLF